MWDPLEAFNWPSLYSVYDAGCGGYSNSSRCLDRFGVDRPATDRDLYYHLLRCYSPSIRAADADPVGTYQALLYWKLYSSGGSKGTNILRWLAPGSEGRRSAEVVLPRLLSGLPETCPRDTQHIVSMIRDLPPIPGMGTADECRLPVRSTFLHFLYPETVPIFDKMVLQAVGVREPGANQDIAVFKRYLPFVWSLADRYSTASGVCSLEVPLRRIDMALWVMRDSSSGVAQTPNRSHGHRT